MKAIMLKIALLVCVIFLTVSCTSFDWDAKPWMGDSANAQLVNFNGETIRCDQPAFDTMTCFDPENIAELKTAIDKVKNKSTRNFLKSKFNKAFRR